MDCTEKIIRRKQQLEKEIAVPMPHHVAITIISRSPAWRYLHAPADIVCPALERISSSSNTVITAISAQEYSQSIITFYYCRTIPGRRQLNSDYRGLRREKGCAGRKKIAREIEVIRHNLSRLYPSSTVIIGGRPSSGNVPSWFLLGSLTRETVMHHRRLTWKVINFPAARRRIHALMRLYFCTFPARSFSNSPTVVNGNVINRLLFPSCEVFIFSSSSFSSLLYSFLLLYTCVIW